MSIFRKHDGFTLLEVLVSFSVILILTAFFPLLLKNLSLLTEKGDGIHPLELEVFIQQATREVRNAKRVSVESNAMVIINQDNQRVTYEFYQKNVRRRVNGTGHELLLHGVESITFKEVNNGAIVNVMGKDEIIHEFKLGAIRTSWTSE
ncbi:competence type IV pilus minor pilin ComGF [Sutcliffiella horikoshii]|uniref:competence type IV pilus minor pilin ComGF n=1 Tax=Sutcliffiella horikoshii TaxID=79883 RepID=UPI003CF9B600